MYFIVEVDSTSKVMVMTLLGFLLSSYNNFFVNYAHWYCNPGRIVNHRSLSALQSWFLKQV